MGVWLNHKTVQKLMQQLQLKSIVREKKYQSYKGQVGKVAPNQLARQFQASAPNEKWVTDVTEFNILGDKVYLSPILDITGRLCPMRWRNGHSIAWWITCFVRPSVDLSRMKSRWCIRIRAGSIRWLTIKQHYKNGV